MKKIICSLALFFLFTFGANVSATSDITPPKIESVEILTKEVRPGGKVKVKVVISDDLSGLKNFSLRFSPSSSTASIKVEYRADGHQPLTNTYILESEQINVFAELGDWKLTETFVSDYAGNINGDYANLLGLPEHLKNISFNVNQNAPIEEVEINDGFKALEPMIDVEQNKEFTIKFNMDVNLKTFTDHNVYVLDQSGNKVPLMFIIDRKADKSSSKIVIMPLNNYRSKSTYTLYVKDVYSTSGIKLEQNTKMKFTTK